MKKSKSCTALSISLMVIACGGGGSGSGDDLSTDTQIPTAKEQPRPNGVYTVTGTHASGDLEYFALVCDYQIHMMSNSNIQFEGEIISYPGTSDYGFSLTMFDASLSLFDQAMVEGDYKPKDYINGYFDQALGARELSLCRTRRLLMKSLPA